MGLLSTEGAANNAFKSAPHSVTNKQAEVEAGELRAVPQSWSWALPLLRQPLGCFSSLKTEPDICFQLNVKDCPAAVAAMELTSNQVRKKQNKT